MASVGPVMYRSDSLSLGQVFSRVPCRHDFWLSCHSTRDFGSSCPFESKGDVIGQHETSGLSL